MTTRLETEEPSGSTDDQATKTGRWPALMYRVLIAVVAVLLFNQAILAGQFMAGTFEALEFHRLGASVAGVVALLAAIAAGVARSRKRYPLWPALTTLLLFVAIQVQEFAGEQRMLAIHIPLGVLVIILGVWLTVWAWRES